MVAQVKVEHPVFITLVNLMFQIFEDGLSHTLWMRMNISQKLNIASEHFLTFCSSEGRFASPSQKLARREIQKK